MVACPAPTGPRPLGECRSCEKVAVVGGRARRAPAPSVCEGGSGGRSFGLAPDNVTDEAEELKVFLALLTARGKGCWKM